MNEKDDNNNALINNTFDDDLDKIEKNLQYLKEKLNEEKILKQIEDEKNHLIGKFDGIKIEIEKSKSINDYFSQYMKSQEITNREIKDTNACLLNIMVNYISPILGIINLVGIFQIISVMKIVNEIAFNSLKYFFIKIKEEEYLNLYDKKIQFL